MPSWPQMLRQRAPRRDEDFFSLTDLTLKFRYKNRTVSAVKFSNDTANALKGFSFELGLNLPSLEFIYGRNISASYQSP